MLRVPAPERQGHLGSLGSPSISTKLAAATEYCSGQPFTILWLWRLTSGAIHGRQATPKGLLDHEVLDSTDAEIRTSMTSGVVVIANILRHVEVYLFELTLLLLRRTGARVQKRASATQKLRTAGTLGHGYRHPEPMLDTSQSDDGSPEFTKVDWGQRDKFRIGSMHGALHQLTDSALASVSTTVSHSPIFPWSSSTPSASA